MKKQNITPEEKLDKKNLDQWWGKFISQMKKKGALVSFTGNQVSYVLQR